MPENVKHLWKSDRPGISGMGKPVSPYFLLRKAIHITSGLVFLWLAAKPHFTLYLGLFVLLAIILDMSRHYFAPWKHLFNQLFRHYLKNTERSESPAGATTLWSGLFVSLIIFPTESFLAAGSVAVVADPLAAIAGHLAPFGRLRSGKTVAGSLVFVFTAFLLLNRYWNIPLIHALIISILLGMAEIFIPARVENFLLCVGGALLVQIFRR
jgi:dolichol kinase